MAKSKTEFVCSSCGYKNPKYLGNVQNVKVWDFTSCNRKRRTNYFSLNKISGKDKPQKLKLIKAKYFRTV